MEAVNTSTTRYLSAGHKSVLSLELDFDQRGIVPEQWWLWTT
jgi:hypothetical protein